MTERCDKMPQMQSSPLHTIPSIICYRICRSVDMEIRSEEKKTLITTIVWHTSTILLTDNMIFYKEIKGNCEKAELNANRNTNFFRLWLGQIWPTLAERSLWLGHSSLVIMLDRWDSRDFSCWCDVNFYLSRGFARIMNLGQNINNIWTTMAKACMVSNFFAARCASSGWQPRGVVVCF